MQETAWPIESIFCRKAVMFAVLVGRARPCISVAVLLSRIGLRSMWTRLALNYYSTRVSSSTCARMGAHESCMIESWGD